MRQSPSTEPNQRLLVAIPNWVGDVVMATPVLAALRARFPAAHITYLMRPYVREVLHGADWCDEELPWRGDALLGTARRTRAARFDLALLMTNSFRSGLLAWLARIPRRVGFARDGRTLLLTDRLTPLRKHGRFVPAPLLDAYVRLAEHVGCEVTDRRLRLGVSVAQDLAGRRLQEHYGLAPGRYALINPGAAFGAAKCWLPERFAEVCDRLTDELELRCAVVGGPSEAPLMRSIVSLARSGPACCDEPGTSLGSLKPLVRDAALLVCNDTGPRHYGNAFSVPTVTIFGPTHQAWTDTHGAPETKLQAVVECGPCQLRTCPIDHRCMRQISVDQVVAAAKARLLKATA